MSLAGTDPSYVGPEAYTILGPPFRKRLRNYEYKIMYESEYLFRAPPRVSEGACESEVP